MCLIIVWVIFLYGVKNSYADRSFFNNFRNRNNLYIDSDSFNQKHGFIPNSRVIDDDDSDVASSPNSSVPNSPQYQINQQVLTPKKKKWWSYKLPKKNNLKMTNSQILLDDEIGLNDNLVRTDSQSSSELDKSNYEKITDNLTVPNSPEKVELDQSNDDSNKLIQRQTCIESINSEFNNCCTPSECVDYAFLNINFNALKSMSSKKYFITLYENIAVGTMQTPMKFCFDKVTNDSKIKSQFLGNKEFNRYLMGCAGYLEYGGFNYPDLEGPSLYNAFFVLTAKHFEIQKAKESYVTELDVIEDYYNYIRTHCDRRGLVMVHTPRNFCGFPDEEKPDETV